MKGDVEGVRTAEEAEAVGETGGKTNVGCGGDIGYEGDWGSCEGGCGVGGRWGDEAGGRGGRAGGGGVGPGGLVREDVEGCKWIVGGGNGELGGWGGSESVDGACEVGSV